MTLADLRRLSVRKQLKIHFRLRNGMECVINEQGVAQAPALKSVPDFSFEEELASAGEFLVEPLSGQPRKVQREELAAMAAASPAAAAAHDHEDE